VFRLRAPLVSVVCDILTFMTTVIGIVHHWMATLIIGFANSNSLTHCPVAFKQKRCKVKVWC
jgi:hypothetical protein